MRKILTRWLQPFWRWREVAFFLVAGCLVLRWLDGLALKAFVQEHRYRHALQAEQLKSQLESSAKAHLSALMGLHLVYQNFVEINAYDFQQYGKSITANFSGFRRLLYVDPQGVIQQVYPLSPDNFGLLGRSVGQNLLPLLDTARRTKRLTTSGLIPFQEQAKTVVALAPIYRQGTGFVGYAVGELSLESIWQPLNATPYRVQILDPQGQPFFPQDAGAISTVAPPMTVPFYLDANRWTLRLDPLQPETLGFLPKRLSLWGSGLLILSLGTLLIRGTRRQKAALDEAHKQFETIFNASPDGIILLNDRLEMQLTNPAIRGWSGLEKSELASKPFFDLFACQCPHLARCRELSFLLCTSEQAPEALPQILETRMLESRNSPESPKTLRLNASRIPPRKETHRNQGFICLLGDISTAKELERIRETHVATLTHDLRTPLLAQEMVLDALLAGEAGPLSSGQQKLLNGARQSARDLLEMVQATLVFYQLEAARLPLHKQRIPLAPLVREVLEALQPLGEHKHLTLELASSEESDAPAHATPWLDPVQFKRVLHNVVSNAMGHADPHSAVRVTLYRELHPPNSGPRVILEICNRGKGIPAEALPKIFDKYYSLSRKFKQIGTGLGLYVSRRIVELHGGRIWVESEPVGETCFFIALPCPEKL